MTGLSKWYAVLAIALAQVIVCRAQDTHDASAPTVTLISGALRGIRFGDGQDGVAFLGVPYAAPPIGELRWKPTEPVARWAGMRDATHFGAACPQLPEPWLAYPHWSEDCLFLNIWTRQISARHPQPVLIFFHGGSNRAGYSQLNQLGPSLSRSGLVVVSANYRLGPLGFLAHPALTAESPHASSGNYGLLDQIQALKWVYENIGRFGGDPGRITVMGQSAGAVDICLLMASPLARDLFQQAILESGDCQSTLNKEIRTPISVNGISGTGEEAGERLAADLGFSSGPDVLKKLRSVPVDAILKAMSRERDYLPICPSDQGQDCPTGEPAIQFDAIVDGWVVPEQPARIFAEGRQAHMPVLVGSNADEATVFGPGPANLSEYRKYLQADTGVYAGEELQAWPASSDAEVPGQYLKLENMSFAYGAWSMARSTTRAHQPAYLYLFTWIQSGKRASMGAHHGEELPFLDDVYPSNWGSSDRDKTFGEILRAYWSNFAMTGDPNSSGLPKWQTFDPGSDRVFSLGQTIGPIPMNKNLRVLDKIMARILSDEQSHRN
jgi:para-nitrobenzyl esterase